MTVPNGNHKTDEYVLHHEPGLDERPLRVICVGAGLSGIYLAIKLPTVAKNIELVIYEKNSDVGGTWFENVYPGCCCDIPAHRYCYTFEPNPSWSSFYAPAPEIQKYISGVGDKYGVRDYIRFEHSVVGAHWNERSGKWEVQVSGPNGVVMNDEADVLVNAMGVLNSWKWPDIPGLHSFKGPLLHSAKYDNDVSLDGKSVAVIGSGSSGIQIIPAIHKTASHVGAYLRSNTWIVQPFGAEFLKKDADGNLITEYPAETIDLFTKEPGALLEHRRALERDVTKAFRIFITNDPSQQTFREATTKYMKSRLSGPKKELLEQKLIPDWPTGCRRLTPGIGFLESLCTDKVETVFDSIASIDETGIITSDGVKREYDVIICATGFDVSYRSRFPFVGRNGRELDEAFGNNPKSYFAMALAGFPNYFCFNGPNAPVGAGSLVPATEAQGDYIVKAILKIQKEGIKSMIIRDHCVEEFAKHTDTFMPTTVWSAGCRSWYKNGKIDGRVTALWPGSGLHFIRALESPRWEDYEYTYKDSTNTYAYLGDGFTPLEWEGGDRTWDLAERTARFANHPALEKNKRQKQENGKM